METDLAFGTFAGFCPRCGSVLPTLSVRGVAACYSCNMTVAASYFGKMKSMYVINFNSIENITSGEESKKDDSNGPVADRRCIKCGNDKMSYAAMQLRSADEGQTVFYTCTKCKYTESENS